MLTNVSVNFETPSKEDAQAKIDSWTLHEGCDVIVSFNETQRMQTSEEGNVVEYELPPPTETPDE